MRLPSAYTGPRPDQIVGDGCAERRRSYAPATGYEIPRIALHSLLPTLRDHALATPEEVDRLDRELQVAKQAERIEWVSSPLMFEWIALQSALSPERA